MEIMDEVHRICCEHQIIYYIIGGTAFGTHSGSWIPVCALLFYSNSGTEPLNAFDIGTLHNPYEVLGIGREGVKISPLSLGKNGVKGERGFSASAQSGDHHKLPAGYLKRDILKVVYVCFGNLYAIHTLHQEWIGLLLCGNICGGSVARIYFSIFRKGKYLVLTKYPFSCI